MTPKKALFIALKEQLKTIPGLELVDWFRGQFDNGSDSYPTEYTTALIRINRVEWETMTQQQQEGDCSVDVILYCKDGWMDQHSNTSDPQHGLIEIDLMDDIVDKIQFLQGEQFSKLEQSDEETEDATYERLMSYRIGFTCNLYKRTPSAFAKARLTTTP
jgi:hypothetical protein